MDENGEHPTAEAPLLDAARGGDRDAYAELFERHRDAARRFAMGLVGDDIRADDLVAEAFAKVMVRLDGGAGPSSNFRAYLFTTIRNCMLDGARRDTRERPVGDLESEVEAVTADESETFVETSVVMQALKRLPPRWREALWHSEVRKESPDELAARFGLKPNAAAVLCYRAREGLRQAYLAEYVARSPTPECERHLANLPAYVRGQLSPRKTEQLEDHLAGCRHCPAAVEELAAVNLHLGALITPALVLLAAQHGLAAAGGHGAGAAYVGRAAYGGRAHHVAHAAREATTKGLIAGVAAAVAAGTVVGLWSLTRGADSGAARGTARDHTASAGPSAPSIEPTSRAVSPVPPASALPPAPRLRRSTPAGPTVAAPSRDRGPTPSVPHTSPEATPTTKGPTGKSLRLSDPVTGAVVAQQAAVGVVSFTARSGRGRVRLVVDLTNVSGYHLDDAARTWSCVPTRPSGSSLRLTCRTARPVPAATFDLSADAAAIGVDIAGTIRADDGHTVRQRRITIPTR